MLGSDGSPWLAESKFQQLRRQVSWLMRQPFTDFLIGVTICANLCCTIVETDAWTQERRSVPWAYVANIAVLGLYNLEVVLKMYAFGSCFWIDGWNAVDILVIITDDVVFIVNVVAGGDIPTVSCFRVIRLVKLAAASRVVPEMAPMVHGMACAFRAVVCGIFLMAAFLVMWSILAVGLLHEASVNAYHKGLNVDCERCPRAFSSVWNSFLTLVQTVVIGDSWGTVVIPVIEESPGALVLFAAMLITISMALLNLILVVIDRLSCIPRDEEEAGVVPPAAEMSSGVVSNEPELRRAVTEPDHFAALMRDLAAQHEMEVLTLRRQLVEARAERSREPLLESFGCGSSKSTQEVAPHPLPAANGTFSNMTAPRLQSAGQAGDAKEDSMTSMIPVQRKEASAKIEEPTDLEKMEEAVRALPLASQDVPPYQEPSVESVPNLPSKFVTMMWPGVVNDEKVVEEPSPQPEHEGEAATCSGVRESPPTSELLEETMATQVPDRGDRGCNSFSADRLNVGVLSRVASSSHLADKAISVLSPKFDMIVGCLIVGNTLVMALELEYRGQKFKQTVLESCTSECGRLELAEDFFFIMEHFFTAVFAIELALQLKIIGWRFITSVSNCLDAIIVVVSMVDSWVLGPLGDDSMGNVAILRLVRLLRLAKVLRVVRVMKAFQSLRVLVGAVANSVGALGWSMTLLFVLELIGAIFMAQVLKPFMEDGRTDYDLREFIFLHFGTWSNAMFTIFEITMAPGGFVRYRRLYEEVHPLFGMFFVVYVCVVTFAVVRVITALFLKATLAASATDDLATQKEHAKRQAESIYHLKEEIEIERGAMTAICLRHLLQLKACRDWLKDASVEQSAATRLFMIMKNDQGCVDFDEWAVAMMQLANPQQHSAEVVMNVYETRSILTRIQRMESIMLRGFGFSTSFGQDDPVSKTALRRQQAIEDFDPAVEGFEHECLEGGAFAPHVQAILSATG